jgi:XTP/dITP diphosphohydrolase
VGFDWDNADQVWDKVQEELGELRAELDTPARDAERVADEFGDVMFALINYARFVDVDPDEALERTNRRFIARFQHLEAAVREEGKDLSDMRLKEMDVYWDRAKEALKG